MKDGTITIKWTPTIENTGLFWKCFLLYIQDEEDTADDDHCDCKTVSRCWCGRKVTNEKEPRSLSQTSDKCHNKLICYLQAVNPSVLLSQNWAAEPITRQQASPTTHQSAVGINLALCWWRIHSQVVADHGNNHWGMKEPQSRNK